VPGETCIPIGVYPVTLRTVGGFHSKDSGQVPGMHRGRLWIRDVPGFEFILIHCGNTEKHTAGCLLVGDSVKQNVSGRGYLSESVAAYKRIYPRIAAVLESGGSVDLLVETL